FAILVEGYLDLIVPYQFGVRNLVASLGTALTPEQVKLVGRFARKVLVNYDGERAGVPAAQRAIETILAEDIEVKVLVLPDDSDPDDFIRKTGVSEYQRRRGEAQPHIQFVIDQAVRDRSLHNPADKAAAVEETLPFVRAVRNRIQKREYFDIVMDSLRVQGDQRRELWQQVRSGASTDAGAVQKVITRRVQPTVAEEKLLGLLLASDELRTIILPRLEPSDYEGLATAPIFQSLMSLNKADKEINFDSLSETTADNSIAAEVLPRLMINTVAESFDESLAQAERCLNSIRAIKLDQVLGDLTSRIAEAERSGNADVSLELQREHFEIRKQRDALDALLPRGHATKSA